tara:strand:+ start:29510 stop:29959 length:450 start_codon:yes stop_codon:yes gene_type:complete
MTLQELLKSTRYKPVFNKVYKHYLSESYTVSKIENMDTGFLRAFDELREMTPETHEDKDVSHSTIYIKEVHQDQEAYIDVCLRNEDGDEYFSLDFLPWKSLLQLNIDSNIKLNKEEMMAHILWELTFWGFSSASVDAQGKKLIDIAEED